MQIAMDYITPSENNSILNDILFTLSVNSYRLYLHYVKIARFPAIYTTYCK